MRSFCRCLTDGPGAGKEFLRALQVAVTSRRTVLSIPARGYPQVCTGGGWCHVRNLGSCLMYTGLSNLYVSWLITDFLLKWSAASPSTAFERLTRHRATRKIQ